MTSDAGTRRVASAGSFSILLADSITEVTRDDRDRMVVTGSHGGLSAARYVLACPVRLAVFNDAGIGKEAAGIAGLAVLAEAGIAALAVSADSAKIGSARDTLDHGVISAVNPLAAASGFSEGEPLAKALERFCGIPIGAIALGVWVQEG